MGFWLILGLFVHGERKTIVETTLYVLFMPNMVVYFEDVTNK